VILDALRKVVDRQDLTAEEAYWTMDEIMSGKATDPQIAALLAALRVKGESVAEITGFARAMRDKVSPVAVRREVQTSISGTDREALVDTCGTGGDASNTFNISTATAFVVAGAGIPVAKHGNRSVSSLCGSADVVEALGVSLELTPEQVGRCIDEVGIGFLYAPLLHKAMKYVMPARRDIRIRTVFNILGPLTNPAGATAQVLGVYHESLTEVLAHVLNELGTRRAFVVHGLDGLDEVSLSGPTRISEVRDSRVQSYTIAPEDLGFIRARLSDLQGGNAAENAQIIKRVLGGEPGPKRDVVLMNASLAIAAGGRAADLHEGVKLAARSIDSGSASEKLRRLVEFSQAQRAAEGSR
jgi:anthranilate phosphoribosyltransferase